MISAKEVIEEITAHFNQVSAKLGYTIHPPEDLVNQMGYGLLRQDMHEKSLAFFKMNVENYPNHSNVYDSLGDYYAAVDEKEKAIKAYEKALITGGGNSYSKEKLDNLKTD